MKCIDTMASGKNLSGNLKWALMAIAATAYLCAGIASPAIAAEGVPTGFGKNSTGQLGDGTTISRRTPAAVSGLSGVTAVAGGVYHSAALKSDGTVWAWGANGLGELGDGTKTASYTPVQAVGLTNVKAVDVGRYHTMALKTDGTVWAWGRYSGESDHIAPYQMPGLTDITSISAGFEFKLALKSDGTVWGWGSNSEGQIGDGTKSLRRIPVQSPYLSNIIALSAGTQHSLALKSDGTVWGWGRNVSGVLGASYPDGSVTPVQISGLSGIKAISTSQLHSLALKTDGTVYSWGLNHLGQLGDGTTTDRSTPAQVPGLSGVMAISVGEDHSLALKSDGTLWAWGSNVQGALGVPVNDVEKSPVQVPGIRGVVAIEAGHDHTLAVALPIVQPIAVNDNFSVNANSMASPLDVLANDSNGGQGTLTITAITQGARGSVFIDNAGTGLTYTPVADYSGPDSFSYAIDNGSGTATGTVNISVLPVFIVSGRIATSTNQPVANVVVTLSAAPTGTFDPVLTGSNGNFSLIHVTAGTYTVTPALAGYSFTPASRTVTVTDAHVGAQDFTAIPWASLGGTIKDASNVAVSGALVTISPVPSGVPATVTTNAGGAYSFPRVPPGTYTLTPVRSGNSFNPGTRGITVATANIANLNFTAGPGYTIAGRIAWSNGVGMANVRVTRTQSTTPIYTNASGYFTFTGVPNGSYQITPSLAPYSMLPAYTVAVVNGANVGSINFTGGYTINGRIYNSAGAAIVNVSVLRTGSPYPVYTNTAGYYTFGGVAPGTYTVTPTLAGYGFAPQTRSMTITDANSVNQNFVASSGYILSGRVMTSTGAAIPNVTVTRSGSTLTAVTNSSGYYTFTGVPNGVYTVTPTLAGKTFAPVNKSVTVSGANVGNQNFIGSP